MKLPRITGDEVVRALKRAGFIMDRRRGSHVILVHPQSRKRVVVPLHTGKIVKPGTLSGILDDAGLSTEELLSLL